MEHSYNNVHSSLRCFMNIWSIYYWSQFAFKVFVRYAVLLLLLLWQHYFENYWGHVSTATLLFGSLLVYWVLRICICSRIVSLWMLRWFLLITLKSHVLLIWTIIHSHWFLVDWLSSFDSTRLVATALMFKHSNIITSFTFWELTLEQFVELCWPLAFIPNVIPCLLQLWFICWLQVQFD